MISEEEYRVYITIGGLLHSREWSLQQLSDLSKVMRFCGKKIEEYEEAEKIAKNSEGAGEAVQS